MVQGEAAELQKMLTDRSSFVRVLREYLDRTQMLVEKYMRYDALEEETARRVGLPLLDSLRIAVQARGPGSLAPV